MKQLGIALVLFFGSLQLVPAQPVNLDVLMGDKKIGSITAAKNQKGKTVNATLSSKVNVTMLFQVNVESTITSEYKDGKLVKTDAVRTSNIKSENKKCNIAWADGKYTITKDEGISTTLSEPVSYCVLDLYFTEPKNITQAFSETGGTYLPITPLENHRYQLQVNDSKKDVFVYGTDGKLIQVETVIAMNKVVFKVRQ
jgi:hypothetical protein